MPVAIDIRPIKMASRPVVDRAVIAALLYRAESLSTVDARGRNDAYQTLSAMGPDSDFAREEFSALLTDGSKNRPLSLHGR
ncbi:hypothetical protein GCM10007937_53730 [Mesorhizobium albiziae]|nr:hypothetical protein GCM10007937_53730 [Mesorhizobium albiziae]